MSKILVLSDLHLGNGGVYDNFAGATMLPRLIASVPGSTIVCNGDMLDFLLDDRELSVEPEVTVARARAIIENPALAAVWEAFAGHLRGGGELVIRPGNHDVEVALPEVQAVVRGRLGECVRFVSAEETLRCEIGGVGVAIAHGEADDDWNRIDWHTLRVDRRAFRYPPGSRLVKQILNPAKRDYGMRFADLLKPDAAGAAIAALAVRPGIVGELGSPELWNMLRQLAQRLTGDRLAATAEGELQHAGPTAPELPGLTEHDRHNLNVILDGGILGHGAVGDAFYPRLLRGALSLFCAAWRSIAGPDGQEHFSLAPGDDEWRRADELGNLCRARVVIFGHTHAARFRGFGGLTMLNTGTWIPLMRLPAFDAPISVWTQLLRDLRDDPGLAGSASRYLEYRFTAALVEATADGVRAGLIRVSDQGIENLDPE